MFLSTPQTHALLLASLLAGAVGCGSDTATPAASSSGDTPNQAPVWADAPSAAVPLKEGISTTIAFTVTDPEGDPVTVSVTPPPLVEAEVDLEAAELRIYADYNVDADSKVVVTLDDGKGGLTSVDVKLAIAKLGWSSSVTWSTEGPEAREHGSFFELEGGSYALFGGSGYNPYLQPLGDAWRFDPSAGTWTALTPTGDLPPPGGSRRVAQTPGSSTAYLFGGYEEGSANSQALYRVDVTGGELAFSELTQVNPPKARSLHGFFYDQQTARFFVYGGYGGGILGDTWMGSLQGDTMTWTDLAPDLAPPKRYGFFYGVDAENGRALVFSGATGLASIKPATDVWVLDMRSEPPAWQMVVDSAQTVAPGRRNGYSIFDQNAQRLFVFGGTADAMTSEEGLFVIDARPGKERLVLLDERAPAPDSRSSNFGFFQGETGQSWMGFGNTKTGAYRDLTALGYAKP